MYPERLMALANRRNSDIPCAPESCSQMFGVVAEGLDDLKIELREARKDLGALNERIAAAEVKTTSAWHSINRMDERVSNLPETVARALARHEEACPGRDYARVKLTSSTSSSAIPRPVDDRPATHPRIELSLGDGDALGMTGIRIPKPILYVGGIIGAAIAASGYLLHSLGVL